MSTCDAKATTFFYELKRRGLKPEWFSNGSYAFVYLRLMASKLEIMVSGFEDEDDRPVVVIVSRMDTDPYDGLRTEMIREHCRTAKDKTIEGALDATREALKSYLDWRMAFHSECVSAGKKYSMTEEELIIAGSLDPSDFPELDETIHKLER